MRRLPIVCMILLSSASSLLARAPATADLDWDAWRTLTVQNGGRQKPLDTLAWETLRLVANRSTLADPQSQDRLEPTAAYLVLLFDWKGWDHEDSPRYLLTKDCIPHYFHLHKPDKWDEAPLLRVDFLELRKQLNLSTDAKHISPLRLAKATVVDPRTQKKIPFPTWGDHLLVLEQQGDSLSELESKALELANHLWAYQHHRMGHGLEILPEKASQDQRWIPLAQLLLTNYSESNDPGGEHRRAQQLFWQARAAYKAGDAAALTRAATDLKDVLVKLGPKLGEYPSAQTINLEVAYNRWAPFRYAWILLLLATVAMLLHMGSKWRLFYAGALVFYASGLLAVVIGFAMRMMIAGRPPVTNMYESVVYVGAGVAVFGLVFEMFYRRSYFLTAAAAVSTIALVLADNCPTVLDPSVRPLQPVLRSNFWLVTHVMTITLSYAAFALALGIANITLSYYLVGSTNREAIHALSRFTYKAMQVGVLLLAAGTILGGVWADYSWGRFWGWDPKEVWALVALLGYLAVLHARYAGWVGQRGLAALSVICFSLVVMAWYGVNFVLGAGLHSYGFGGGGKGFVYAGLAIQLLFVLIALARSYRVDAAKGAALPAESNSPSAAHLVAVRSS